MAVPWLLNPPRRRKPAKPRPKKKPRKRVRRTATAAEQAAYAVGYDQGCLDCDETPKRKNPGLAIVSNPPKKRRKTAMARRMPPRHRSGPKKGQFRKRAGGSRKRRTRRRRNPGGQTFSAPTKSMRAAPRSNPPRRRRRRSGGGGRKLFGFKFPPIKTVAAGTAGMALSRIVPGYAARFLPMIPTAGPLGLVVRAFAAVLVGNIGGRFLGRAVGDAMAFGGLIAVADDAAALYVYPMIGVPGASAGMGAYLDEGLGAYVPTGVGSYLSPGATLPYSSGLSGLVYQGEEDAGVGRLDAGNRL